MQTIFQYQKKFFYEQKTIKNTMAALIIDGYYKLCLLQAN